jgi:hypothetical protein
VLPKRLIAGLLFVEGNTIFIEIGNQGLQEVMLKQLYACRAESEWFNIAMFMNITLNFWLFNYYCPI